MHFLQHFQPYICTYPSCDLQDVRFADEKSWMDHENTERSAWMCPDCSPNIGQFRSPVGLWQHLTATHTQLQERDIRVIIKYAYLGQPEDRTVCVICRKNVSDTRLLDHVADHLKCLVFLALYHLETMQDMEAAFGAERSEYIGGGEIIIASGPTFTFWPTTDSHKALTRQISEFELIDSGKPFRRGKRCCDIH